MANTRKKKDQVVETAVSDALYGPNVRNLHDIGFVKKYEAEDPGLLGLVLAQAHLLDLTNRCINEVAAMEGRIDAYLVERYGNHHPYLVKQREAPYLGLKTKYLM